MTLMFPEDLKYDTHIFIFYIHIIPQLSIFVAFLGHFFINLNYDELMTCS